MKFWILSLFYRDILLKKIKGFSYGWKHFRNGGALKKANIQNVSIYLGNVDNEDENCLYSYLEYTGKNFEKDILKASKAISGQDWLEGTEPLLFKLTTAKEDEGWSEWKEVFHYNGLPYADVTSQHGMIIGLPEENILTYTQMHLAVWPGVLQVLEKANIVKGGWVPSFDHSVPPIVSYDNYSQYLKELKATVN